MHREPDTLLHQVVGGRWRLLQVLQATPDGAAFRAETLEDGRPVRLELWDQRHVEGRGELARFEREARTLSRLRHERCLSIVAFGAHEGRPFLVSELPDGTPLRDALGKEELTVARALSLGLQLCEGLRHLHGHGVVHRALVPDNLWITQASSGDLLKIGLPRTAQATHAADTPGERLYVPPRSPAARPDRRADLYAAGMLLYVMCTGREPPAEVVAAIAGGASVPPPRTVSPERAIGEELERVILRVLAPSPYVRFDTADELLAALQGVGARPAAPRRRPVQRPRRRTAMVATAFAVVAILGAGALRGSGSRGPGAPPVALAAPPANVPSPAREPVAPAPAAPAPVAAPPVAPRPVAAPAPAPVSRPAPVAPRAPAPVPAPQVVAAPPPAPPSGEHGEIWALLDSGRLNEGAARIKTLAARDPDSAWPEFALGVLYYRKYWRGDSVTHWKEALARDPDIRLDPQFGAYLCFMLDDAWQAAGMADLLTRLGPRAVPLLDSCAASAKTPRLRALASRALDRVRRGSTRSGSTGRPRG
jgi:hypothetical protein